MIAVSLSACRLATFSDLAGVVAIQGPVVAARCRRRCVRRGVDLYVTCAGIGSIRPWRRVPPSGATKAPGGGVIVTDAVTAAKNDVLQ